MVHKKSPFLECDFNPNAIAWIKCDGVFPTLFIGWWGVAIPDYHLELDAMQVEWMDHATQHVPCVFNLPNFLFPDLSA